jgi:TnpA family transposase
LLSFVIKSKKNKQLSILSPLEEFAFYGFPDFDDEQRATYLEFTESELKFILKCLSLQAKVYCALQLGYFKAKKIFFTFSLKTIPQADLDYIFASYFPGQSLDNLTITKYEIYLRRDEIADLFGYKVWSNCFLTQLNERAKLTVNRDISPNFIAHELLNFLEKEKIIRPGYTTLQTIVIKALSQERQRLKSCLKSHLTEAHRQNLDQLLKNEDSISELAALKQDAKNFGYMMMGIERKKHETLKPLYFLAKTILVRLGISQQNISHYASLAHHYTAFEMGRFNDEQAYLYILCYVAKRYTKINDNLVDALGFNVKKFEKQIKENAKSHLSHDQANDSATIGKLLLLYVDDSLTDISTFGEMRKLAFDILPKESIKLLGEKLLKKTRHQQDSQWKERDKASARYKHHLRPLFVNIDFESKHEGNPLIKAIEWMKQIFEKQQSLAKQPADNFPKEFISKRLERHILTTDKDGKVTSVHAERYEILVYRQIIKQLETGAIHIEDSINHRTFGSDLVPLEKKGDILKELDIRWLKTPCNEQIHALFETLDGLLTEFNTKLKQGSLANLKYDDQKKVITWVKPKLIKEGAQGTTQTLYDKLPIRNVADVLRFVNQQCGFLSVFTPLQPLYKKLQTDEDHLIAVITGQGTNINNHKMAQTSDISYSALEATYKQRLRLSSINKAHDIIANKFYKLGIFKHYTFDHDVLYGAVDGQKFCSTTPTAKARYSRKYYGKGRGIVAYTMLTNHVPIQCELIGSHEHESHFVFDIWYGNTSLITPSIVTGDMHSINKVNFALLHWFGGELRPRLSSLKKELKHIYCGKNIEHYKHFISPPVGQIDKQIIIDESENISQIVATLALKEISQRTLVRKLCGLPPQNSTRKAVSEYNKLLQSIYILQCILEPSILHHVHRSQNRVESYHNLRASISRAGGGKSLLGRTDLEMEISNQCGRLIATAIIYYNACIHTRLLDTTDASNKKQLNFLKKKISPVAWQHLHFTGNFTFYNKHNKIDIDKLIENIQI